MTEEDVPAGGKPPAAGWERDVLEKLVLGTLQERRRARRWGIFFKLLAFAWLVAALLLAGGWLGRETSVSASRHTALVELRGVIAAGSEAAAEDIVSSLRAAFDDSRTAGVVLRINSPGGSPVQAGIIHDEIRRLRALHPRTPLYAVVEEVCASGGYYVAAAADRIYVDKASLVGSIGVLMEGFGFVGAMEKLGIERRLLTAGSNKGFLDSFSPLPEDQRQHAQAMLDEIHKQFIEVVRTGRGERLKDSPELFSGLVWTGARSVEMGLADALGSVDSVARDVVKAAEVVDFSTRKNLAERLARRFGAAAGETMAAVLGAAAQATLIAR
ncbi:MAG: S49 family peptidase [Lautropia sp.]|nr:S49 family peptidase [Lautropia sp.]MCL4700228.1 S49 family peptidase [Burkholderiaceae bacterium]MDL1906776.1 S49 family peptidase [Betaproteobacteria bacterium PRO1]RIK86010.1 MAG: S49 family peptidase [Burkholderiales bacterium]